MTFKERILEEAASPASSPVSEVKSSGPSSTEQLLKNDTTTPVTAPAVPNKPESSISPIQKDLNLNSGYADFNYREKSDTPRQTPNDILKNTSFLSRMTNNV